MKCLKCSTHNPDVAVYCQDCGAWLAESQSAESLDLFKALLLGAMLSSIFYLVYPMPVIQNEFLKQLFDNPISEVITGLSLWSLFIILFKYRSYRRQYTACQAFRHKELHASLAKGIYVKDVESRIQEVAQFLENQGIKRFQNSILFRRVRRMFYYFKSVPKKEELNSILDYQAEIDHTRMQNSYTVVNVFIWAIPILGFIGTVFGIAQSVGEFSDFIRQVDATALGSQMRSALGGVTSGLSIAFNTTFLALMCVIPIMLGSSFLRKSEEDLLLLVEEYCLEELLPNLHSHPGAALVQESSQQHLEQIQEFSERWLSQMTPVLDSASQHSSSLSEQMRGLQPLLKDFSESFFQFKDASLSEPELSEPPATAQSSEDPVAQENQETESEESQ